jgi:hypothetical protein
MIHTPPSTKAGAQAMITAHLEQLEPLEVDRTLLKTLAEAIPHLA